MITISGVSQIDEPADPPATICMAACFKYFFSEDILNFNIKNSQILNSFKLNVFFRLNFEPNLVSIAVLNK